MCVCFSEALRNIKTIIKEKHDRNKEEIQLEHERNRKTKVSISERKLIERKGGEREKKRNNEKRKQESVQTSEQQPEKGWGKIKEILIKKQKGEGY